MSFKFKLTFYILLIAALMIFGFMYSLRGCLAKYDERSAMPRALYFEKGNEAIVFSIVKFEKATSYSQNGGITQKTVSTSYSIQANDAKTGTKLKEKKVKNHSDINEYPIEVMGATSDAAWVFIGEIMAFDPFTLTQIADKKTLEEKNPSLIAKFPDEERFYKFNREDKNIYFTATDGSTWILDTKSLKADPADGESEDKEYKDITHFGQMKVNGDTIGSNWYGLYSNKEMAEAYNRFSYQQLYNETARRQLYKSVWAPNNSGDPVFSKETATTSSTSYFLDGGFLLSRETGFPIRMNNSYLVIFHNQVGNDAKLQLSRVDMDGKVEWTFDSQLKKWEDYIFTGKQMIITGANNKNLSSDECNVLWCVDLSNGKTVKYDFFTDKN